MSGYRTLVIDPPWPQKGNGRPLGGGPGSYRDWSTRVAGTRARPLAYDLMTLPQIAALPIRDLIDPAGAHLYLWATNGFLPAAFDVLRAWGFSYSTTLVWAKTPMGGGLGGRFGISTEFVLHARRGVVREETRRPRVRGTWWHWKRPYDHRGKPMGSAKPGEFYDVVEQASPGPYLEMFARRAHPGWDAWGDQAPDPVALPALAVPAVAG